MEPVRVTTTDTKVTVHSPFCPAFPARARGLGGRWVSDKWEFAARDDARVRALCVEMYGSDGDDGAPTVDLHVDVNVFEGMFSQQALFLAGREIAHRPGRDSSVRLGQDVILIQGSFPGSGGSVRNPVLNTREGTILEVRGVPAAHPDTRRAGVTVLTESIDVEALRAEREHLVARIAEIDALIGANA